MSIIQNKKLFSYQNPEPWHIKVDMVEWGPKLHTSALRVPLTGGGTYKTKDFDTQVRMCVRRVKQLML